MKLKSLLSILVLALSFELSAVEYKIHNFDDLSRDLGYPSETFFGSTEDEVMDLETYTSKEDSYYREINGYLRYFPADYEWSGITPESAKKMVHNIDQIFQRVPALPQGLILFRGVELKYRKNKSFKIGEEFSDKGYVSTSTTFRVANYFANEMDGRSYHSKRAIFVLYQNQPGQKGILIDQNEDEVIINHGQTFKVMSAKKATRSHETYLIQICKTICDQQMNQDIDKFWKNYQEK